MKRCRFTGVLCDETSAEDFEMCGCNGDCDFCENVDDEDEGEDDE